MFFTESTINKYKSRELFLWVANVRRYKMVVLQKLAKNRKFPRKGIDYAATPLVRLIKRTRSLTAALGTPETCPFLIMWISRILIHRDDSFAGSMNGFQCLTAGCLAALASRCAVSKGYFPVNLLPDLNTCQTL